MTDIVLSTLQHALRGLTMRQRAQADNISNIQTPGYRAARVDFEASLSRAFAAGDPTNVRYARTRSVDSPDAADNNVNLDDETVAMVETNLRYQTMVEAMNAKYGLLRTAIKG